ncbi:MAG: CBS domain-containing protein [Nitrospinae bacterium]|nr:CBS domain-containing protein [Nitrospinota bacterium]
MNKIGDYMSTTIYSTRPDTLAHEAINKMYENKVGALLVQNNGDYTGIFTKTDWMVLVLKGECDPKAVKVSNIMTELKHTIDINQTISEASAIIESNKIRHIPVKENGKIVGMFSVKDLEKYYLELHKKTDF